MEKATLADGTHLKVVGTIRGPAAAALDYLYFLQNLLEEDKRIDQESYTVLVYDLGHGTFDAAVVTVRRKGEPYQLH